MKAGCKDAVGVFHAPVRVWAQRPPVAEKEVIKSPIAPPQCHRSILLQASTLGSLEALLSFLQDVCKGLERNPPPPARLESSKPATASKHSIPQVGKPGKAYQKYHYYLSTARGPPNLTAPRIKKEPRLACALPKTPQGSGDSIRVLLAETSCFWRRLLHVALEGRQTSMCW